METIRTVVILFGVVVAVVIAIAYVTTLNDMHIQTASNAPAGTVGLAKPHPPLDRAPGQELPVRR